jgi:hypothetical protein
VLDEECVLGQQQDPTDRLGRLSATASARVSLHVAGLSVHNNSLTK